VNVKKDVSTLPSFIDSHYAAIFKLVHISLNGRKRRRSKLCQWAQLDLKMPKKALSSGQGLSRNTMPSVIVKRQPRSKTYCHHFSQKIAKSSIGGHILCSNSRVTSAMILPRITFKLLSNIMRQPCLDSLIFKADAWHRLKSTIQKCGFNRWQDLKST
jgi:hypothetical protein